jgi:hypothetical protein
VVVTAAFTAQAWRSGEKRFVKQDPIAAQAAPAQANNDYVRRSKLASRLRAALDVLGDRLEKPGKERLIIEGTITRSNSPEAAPFRLFLELPGRMRLEEKGARSRVIGFDGKDGWAGDDLLNDDDQKIIETLVFDSTDYFFQQFPL